MIAFAAALTALVGFVQTAHAWVPPSFFVVRKLSQKHEHIQDVVLHSRVTVYKSNGEQAHNFSETLTVPDHERVSIRLNDEAGNLVVAHTRRLLSANSSRSTDLHRPIPYDLLMINESANIYEHFKGLGLPLKTESELYSEKQGNLPYKPEETVNLNRYETRIAVTVAEGPAKELASNKTPQLWVEKDSYLPLKAVFPTAPERGMASDPLEFRFAGYQPYKNFLYPRTMQVYRNGTLWVKVETQDVKTGTGAKLEEPKSNNGISGDEKEFLEMYFKWVR